MHRRSAQPTHSCHLSDVHLARSVRWIMSEEHRRDFLLGCLRPAHLLPLGLRILHATLHSCPDRGKLQPTEDTGCLQECFAHWNSLPIETVQCDAACNHQTQVLFLNPVDALSQLLCASGQTRNLQHNDGNQTLLPASPAACMTIAIARSLDKPLAFAGIVASKTRCIPPTWLAALIH